MAEENTEDLSMEDILSSIKDILTEEEQAQKPAAPAPTVAEPAASAPAEEPVEDILELSPSMRIEDELANPADEINLEDELGEISPNLEAISADETTALPEEEFNADDILNSLPSLEEDKDLDSDPFDVAAAAGSDLSAEEAVFEPAPADNSWDWEKEEEDASEPFIQAAVEELTLATPEPAAELAPAAPEPEPAPEETVIEFEAEDFAPQQEPEIAAVDEPEVEPEPEIEIEPEPEVETEPAVEEPQPAGQPQAETLSEPETDAVDVSASIINNFAKMFASEGANETKAAKTVDLPAEPVVDLGNAATTIEEVVSKVIRSIIGDEVAANWRKSADYDTLAREEIKAQTKQWLDKNLPALVEKIVKQEIERVMAKVGSQD